MGFTANNTWGPRLCRSLSYTRRQLAGVPASVCRIIFDNGLCVPETVVVLQVERHCEPTDLKMMRWDALRLWLETK